MGNHITTVLAAILCAVTPLASSEDQGVKKEFAESNLRLGKDSVSFVRTAYEAGEYDDFLEEMDASYRGANLSGLIQMRSQEAPVELDEQWEEKFRDLRLEKNRELLNAISDRDDSLFAQKVRSAAANLETSEQAKALGKLNRLIAMAPKSGANGDENVLIDLDLEYEYKELHAQLPVADGSFEKREDRQIALRMEKMDKMIQASKNFEDPSLKQAVGIAAASLDERLARNLDGADLYALAKGGATPNNDTEKTVYSILSAYQEKFAELMKSGT